MAEILLTLGLAVLFGFGVSLTTLALTLFYRVYFDSPNYDRPLIITAIAFVFLWVGMICLFIVTV